MTLNSDTSDKIRLLDMHHDLDQVADLIEICFIHQMDPDGKRYLQQIRTAAKNRLHQRYFQISGMQISYPIYGYVWEEDKKIVGNITIIPHMHSGKWYFLVANIAVNPKYRRRGIARALTKRAIMHLKNKKLKSIWLQVREDNTGAIDLYRALGFKEQAKRTMWILNSLKKNDYSPNNDISIEKRKRNNWHQQKKWLLETYPAEITWYLPFEMQLYKPGFYAYIQNFLNGKISTHWAAYNKTDLIGVATWQPTNMFADLVWLGIDHKKEEDGIEILLNNLHKYVILKKPLLVNYPFGRGINAFSSSGFSIHNSLIWMKYGP